MKTKKSKKQLTAKWIKAILFYDGATSYKTIFVNIKNIKAGVVEIKDTAKASSYSTYVKHIYEHSQTNLDLLNKIILDKTNQYNLVSGAIDNLTTLRSVIGIELSVHMQRLVKIK